MASRKMKSTAYRKHRANTPYSRPKVTCPLRVASSVSEYTIVSEIVGVIYLVIMVFNIIYIYIYRECCKLLKIG